MTDGHNPVEQFRCRLQPSTQVVSFQAITKIGAPAYERGFVILRARIEYDHASPKSSYFNLDYLEAGWRTVITYGLDGSDLMRFIASGKMEYDNGAAHTVHAICQRMAQSAFEDGRRIFR